MYAKLKALMVEHQMTQQELAILIPLAPSNFNRKVNQVEGLDFSITQGKIIQEIFKEKGSDLSLDEIFFVR